MARVFPTAFILSAAVLLVSTDHLSADTFSDRWYDGTAEVSTYEISEMQYGEQRKGTRVMVFATEPMRLSTHIKPDSKLPSEERIGVLKLNDIRKFNTGIYDYSVMTSVFGTVEERGDIPLWGTMKVAFSNQEWCGTVFERTLRTETGLKGTVLSYFESEGEHEYALPSEVPAEAEEILWLRVRELRGPTLKEGESTQLRVLPSAWSRRKAHTRARLAEATLSKGKTRAMVTKIGKVDAAEFTWVIDGKKTRVFVESDGQRRILAWEEPDGSSGVILASRREAYWKRNRNNDERLREELRLQPPKRGQWSEARGR